MGRYSPFVAAALIIAALAIGFMLMPRIMLAASGAGPLGGAAIAVLFIVALFVVLWLRARYQRRFDGE
jgi:hypothetical protein